ncbi:MAG: polyketide cyclase [Methanobacterium sp. BRmetb2]|jgi:hypothetical protein|nr:MAG: polyketide cyclase [Methanobacterium sp. BRmetb2]
MIKINEDAPVIARSKIEINAEPERVWNLLSDINNWSKWNPDIETTSLKGNLEKGTGFRWKTSSGTITSTLQLVDPPEILAWTGKIMSIKAIHIYQLESENSETLVKTEESWEGLLARILRGTLQKQLQKSIDAGLQYLKTAAE